MSDYRDSNYRGVGEVGNAYGGLNIAECDGKYYWCIEEYDVKDWEQIPKYLYDALFKFEEERDNG